MIIEAEGSKRARTNSKLTKMEKIIILAEIRLLGHAGCGQGVCWGMPSEDSLAELSMLRHTK